MANPNKVSDIPTDKLHLSWFRPRLDIVYQNEIAECGAACLAMVSGYHGHPMDMRTFRAKYPFASKGVTLKDLTEIAEDIGFSARAIQVPLEHIGNVRCPAVVHWEMDHFVVLKKVSRKHVHIHDPAQGVRKLTKEQFSKSFTGIVLELWPTGSFEVKDERCAMGVRGFLSGITGLKRSMAQIIAMSLALLLFGLLGPYYTQIVVDHVLVGQDRDFLVVVALGFIVIAIITTSLSIMRQWMGIYLGTTYNLQLTSRLFKHTMNLPMGWFEARHMGDILSRFGSLQAIRETLVSGIVGGTLNITVAIATLVVMLAYSPKLTLVPLVAVAAYVVLRAIFYRPFKRATQEQIVRGAEEESNFIQTMGAMGAVKSSGKESNRFAEWSSRVVKTMNAGITMQKYGMVFNILQTFLSTIENILMLWLGAVLVLDTTFTVGMLFAFMAWKSQFVGSIYGLVDGFFAFKMLSVHLDRVSDIALEKSEYDEDGDGGKEMIDTSTMQGKLELKKVSFRFGQNESWLFKDVFLTIDAGECVAFKGPSGLGKSTFLKVLSGLLKPGEGDIIIDGVDLNKIGLNNYRKITASVLQGDNLFAGTIEENISFFDYQVDRDYVVHCAKMAGIAEEIDKMPMGYQSLVGDMGSLLSGGQAQRVLIARALYQKPKILFMDEASSHLDAEIEGVINRNIKNMAMTRVMVAHRSETLDIADRVIDLRDIAHRTERASSIHTAQADDHPAVPSEA